MNDRPDAGELVEAVRGFLEKELLPTLADARLRFQTLVAMNVLAVARREMAMGETHGREEAEELAALLGEPATDVLMMNVRLCGRIEAGDFDGPEARRVLMAELRRQVARKREVTGAKGA